MSLRYRLLAGLIGALVLAGCGPGVQRVTPVQKDANQALRWALTRDSGVAGVDPATASTPDALLIAPLLYSGLLRVDARLQPVADAARSWTVSADQKTYTFQIRANLRFSDGSDCGAPDVAWSISRAMLLTPASDPAAYYLHHIEGATYLRQHSALFLNAKNPSIFAASGLRVINARTLAITLDQPLPNFLDALTTAPFFILERRAVLVFGGTVFTTAEAGTGPFQVSAWDGDDIELIANKDSDPSNAIPRLSLRFVASAALALQALGDGQADLATAQPVSAASGVVVTTATLDVLGTGALPWTPRPDVELTLAAQPYVRGLTLTARGLVPSDWVGVFVARRVGG